VVVEGFLVPGLGRYILEASLQDVFAIEAAAMVLVIIAMATQLVADVVIY
jgi:peptide/nickel transport system permease protein